MKTKKAYVIPVIIVAVVIVFSVVAITLLSPEKRIFRLVDKHQSELQEFVQDNLQNYAENDSSAPKDFLGCEIDYVADGNVPIVQFDHSAKGIVSASTYYGFYYSPDDQPHAYCNYDAPLEQTNSNEWSYRMDGDNRGLTKKIRQNWYYYEVRF